MSNFIVVSIQERFTPVRHSQQHETKRHHSDDVKLGKRNLSFRPCLLPGLLWTAAADRAGSFVVWPRRGEWNRRNGMIITTWWCHRTITRWDIGQHQRTGLSCNITWFPLLFKAQKYVIWQRKQICLNFNRVKFNRV